MLTATDVRHLLGRRLLGIDECRELFALLVAGTLTTTDPYTGVTIPHCRTVSEAVEALIAVERSW